MRIRRVAAAVAAAIAVSPLLAAPAYAASTCNTWRTYLGAYVPSYGTNVSCQMRRGNVSNGVLQLQQSMNICYEEMLRNRQLYPLGLDGNFGGRTESALKAVQSFHGITADGIYGGQTRDTMRHQRSGGGMPCVYV
ncbi:peptidoglycan-binding domain-containing protein [Micromonospora purpureochromogenes]|uniref:peptidoglycan-binding domain-containing protein n=1 Tax=Micromonospora purpureochromogenes TaxID=47872 RepID=UPI00362F446F